jgi:hypothetical protein
MSVLEQTDTDDAPEADVELTLRAYYQHEFARFGDAPATDALLAWLAPALDTWHLPRIRVFCWYPRQDGAGLERPLYGESVRVAPR